MSKLCVDLFLATNCKWFNVEANNSQDAVWIIKIINFIAGWELLKDPAGRDHFLSFLEKEYATENLLFVESVWHLKKLPVSEVKEKRIGMIGIINVNNLKRLVRNAASSGPSSWPPRRSIRSMWTPSLTKSLRRTWTIQTGDQHSTARHFDI